MRYSRSEWHSGLTYKQTCDKCGTSFLYNDYKLGFRMWFKDGFVYCPKCRNPLGHNEAFAVEYVKYGSSGINDKTTNIIINNNDNNNTNFNVNTSNKSSSGKIICQNCNKSIDANSKFCNFCGAQMGGLSNSFCNNCGAKLSLEMLFCPECGKKVK